MPSESKKSRAAQAHDRTRLAFLDALRALAEQPDAGTASAFRKALLDFGSETPDNVACIRALDVGPAADRSALVFSGTETEPSDLANCLEDLPFPKELRRRFPELDHTHWDALTRLTTLMLVALKPPKGPQDRD